MTTQISEVVEQEIRIAARPETIWSFLTESDKMIRWMGKSATLEPQPGGIFRVYMTERNTMRGEFLELDPFHRLVFSMGWENPEELVRPGESTVEITLTEDGDSTLLRLRHMGLPVAEQASHAEGWAYFLSRLIDVAEGRAADTIKDMPQE